MTTWIKGIAALSLFLLASLCLQRFRSNFSAVEVKRAGLEASEFAPEPAAEPAPDSLMTTTNGATVTGLTNAISGGVGSAGTNVSPGGTGSKARRQTRAGAFSGWGDLLRRFCVWPAWWAGR